MTQGIWLSSFLLEAMAQEIDMNTNS